MPFSVFLSKVQTVKLCSSTEQLFCFLQNSNEIFITDKVRKCVSVFVG